MGAMKNIQNYNKKGCLAHALNTLVSLSNVLFLFPFSQSHQASEALQIHRVLCHHAGNFYLFLNCFYGLQALFCTYLFSSATPQRTAYSEVPVASQMAFYLRIGSPLQAGEIAGYEPG
jgi:hypothetical protein